jgi:phytoene synthase
MSDAREILAPEARLALAYTPAAMRPQILAILALDARMAELVRGAREVILGQMRLAWWRDALAADPAGRRQGDPVLAALRAWPGDDAALSALVDGWEFLLGDEPLTAARIDGFAAGRAAAWAALGGEPAARTARRWALADLAGHCRDRAERELVASTARPPQEPLPRALRGLAMLAVGRADDGTPRPWRALRLGLLGR